MNVFRSFIDILSDRTVNERGYFFSNKALFALFLPLLVEQALEFCVGLADSMMVASLGEVAISGVSLVDFLVQLLIFSFSALATGGAVIAGQYLGNDEPEKACDASNQLVWFTTILAVIMAVLVLIFRPFLINLFFGQIEPDVFNTSSIYLSYMAISIPFIAIYNSGAAIFRTMNKANLPMQIMFVCDILNVIGNAILLFVFGFGVEGVAIPTVLARALAAVIMIYFVLQERYEIHIRKTLRHKFDWVLLRKVLNVGIPYGVENGVFQLGRILILSLVSTFGTIAIAANSVGYAIGIFSVLPGFAINLGLTAVISRCVGHNDYEQAKFYNKKILIITFLSHLAINLLIFALLPYILQIYNLSPAASALTYQMVVWHGIFAVLIWPIAFTLPTTFRGAGDAKWPMAVSLSVMFICRIALSYVIADFMGVGVFGTWIAMFIDWYVRAAFYVYRYFSGKWMEYRAVGTNLS
ncbi:MatE efflux family protein [Methanobrevibacter ruminantium M1]|uniref:Multidrug-efflux transporter n=1 Tax=Methanobrevibacter ruminantium (strain ATCC 35063 / DSM 1093 / JCM 13430 / OCM 146 / M1) TaxID=634498 RepID=D3DZ65_METRM|nr:MATE family efflux transporter [Methanobrevibacter ruminantium]ADC47615.1 MatE efflux family protein [Methanobrevibacter ruminantium M1]